MLMTKSPPVLPWILIGCLALALLVGSFFLTGNEASPVKEAPKVVETQSAEWPLDEQTGFVADGDYRLVIANCTGCHASQLVIQNRATEQGWRDMIRWMQETQGLWPLGDNEDKIVAYLATHYAPEETGRRTNLVVEDWYEIN